MFLALNYKNNKFKPLELDLKDQQILNDVNDPKIAIIIHKQKRMILLALIKEELNINQLKDLTNINPGTIKRHLDNLIENELVIQTQTIKNEYGFVLKYYRAVARKFVVNLEWP